MHPIPRSPRGSAGSIRCGPASRAAAISTGRSPGSFASRASRSPSWRMNTSKVRAPSRIPTAAFLALHGNQRVANGSNGPYPILHSKNMHRRDFLTTALAGAALAASPYRSALGAPRRLQAKTSRVPLVGGPYPETEVWGYEGLVPGPELRFRQGERLVIEVENLLPDATTVHWHGVRLPNAMDGVPHLTQAPIKAKGGRFVYEFALPDAGTFWYHPHLGSPEQVARGLYGALIVDEHEPPPVDRDLVWMLGGWRLDREARIVANFGNFMDASHAGRIGNTVTVNGALRESFEVFAGERLRLRLVNAANARVFALDLRGHQPLVIALDGHPVAPHRPD